MSKYPMVRLADAFSLQMGKTPSRDCSLYWENGTNKWLSISDINKDSKFISETKEYITDKAVLESGIKHVPENTVIMSFKLSIGKTAITTCPIYTNEAIMAFIPKEEVSFDISFLYHLFANKNWSNGSNKAVKGSTLNKASLSITQIPYPTKEEQKRISKNLDKIFYLIQRRKQQLSKFDELAKSRFLEMFGQCGEDRFGWGVSRLGDCCIINPSKSTEARLEDELEVSFCPMPYVSESGDIKTGETKLYKDVKSGFTYFAEEDVLFAKITPCMENGKGAIARNLKNGIGFGSTEFHILRPNRSIITPEWLYVLTTFKQFRKDAEANMTGSAGQKRVPSIFLRNYKISIPPLEMQKQYVGILEQLDKSKFRIKKSLEKLELTYKALLQEYFG